MPHSLAFDSGSYRDREARVFYGADGEVFRALSQTSLSHWNRLSSTQFFASQMAAGAIVGTKLATAAVVRRLVENSPADAWAGVLEHERIPFVSYPYEWSFSMLRDAALLQLHLLQQGLAEEFTIKDGTSYNIQWNGSKPVFIDIASFEPVVAGLPWAGYRQFCQTFLFPLIVQSYKGFDFHPFLRGRLDGMSPTDIAQLFSWRDFFRPGVFTHVWVHSRFDQSRSVQQSNIQQSLPQAGFDKSIVSRTAAGLSALVEKMAWKPESRWSNYAVENSYTERDAQCKAEFVRQAVQDRPTPLAWDLGCNTGEYAKIIAEHAEYTVALDSDQAAIERLYLSLKSEPASRSARTILPLVMNLADPSPNQGWRTGERKGLIERGQPDFILCLALVHHLVLGAGIRLHDFLKWLAGFQARVVIEFVDRQDPMVEAMLRNRRDLCADYDLRLFERWIAELFSVERTESLASGTRSLYYLVPRVEIAAECTPL